MGKSGHGMLLTFRLPPLSEYQGEGGSPLYMYVCVQTCTTRRRGRGLAVFCVDALVLCRVESGFATSTPSRWRGARLVCAPFLTTPAEEEEGGGGCLTGGEGGRGGK